MERRGLDLPAAGAPGGLSPLAPLGRPEARRGVPALRLPLLLLVGGGGTATVASCLPRRRPRLAGQDAGAASRRAGSSRS